MFTEEEKRNIKAFEDAAIEAGGYFEPLSNKELEEMKKYDIRAIARYKKENNIPDLVGLTEEQLAPFVRQRTIAQ